VDQVAFLSRFYLVSFDGLVRLEQLVSAFTLAVVRILNLDPLRRRIVSTVPVLRDNAFQIFLADHPEEIDAVAVTFPLLRPLI